jgi:hypothetical protein
VRGGACGAILLLLPLPWLLETGSCGGERTVKTVTGAELVGELGPAWWLILAVGLGTMVVVPALARGRSAGWALLLHLGGLVVTAGVLWVGWLILFLAIFTERTLKVGGWGVVTLLGLCGLDALARPVLAARTWWQGRRQGPDDALR